MRNMLMTLTAALLCSAPLAHAQQPAPAEAPAGVVDLGIRAGTMNGDFARYERYRDLRDGVFSKVEFGKDTGTTMFRLGASNIGYRDQNYQAEYTNGKATYSGFFDSTPLNYSYLTSTPWVESQPGVFTLNAAARLQVQNKVAGVVGVPSTAAQLATRSIYVGIAQPFDLQSKRDTLGLRYARDMSQALGFNLAFTSTKKAGRQPFGMSFAFNNANELPMPLDNRTNDLAAGLEYVRPEGMVRLGWDASFFDNKIKEVLWDNPLRATDTNPYDPSGYSNGNGPAFGRMSVPPSNSMNTVSATGLYKMPAHTTINGIVSFTAMNQDDELIPWTSNAVINQASVWAAFPELRALPRTTAEARVHGVNAMFNFTSRPNRHFGLRMRYRFNDHKNLTPEFDAVEYVRFDAVPEETGGETEHFNIRQNSFDLTGTLNLIKYTAISLGYTYEDFARTGRAFSDMRDYTFKASVDTVGNQYVTLRAAAEHTNRIGAGFSEDAIEDGGSQPGLRFYDEADRDRDKGTLLLVVNPVSILDVTASVSKGQDTYKGEGHEFGLLDNDNTNVTIAVGVTPSDALDFGASYGRDRFVSNQKSRNANPPPDPQFTDPTRDWTLKNDELVNNVDVYLNLPKLIAKSNLRFNYDYADSDNGFIFGGPRITSLAAAGTFIPLPNVTNKWRRLSADFQYHFTSKVGAALGYWYEKFDVTDFATVNLPDGSPRIDYLGEINTGYGNRPYKGSTGFVRLLYFF
ncbi:MAG TPA: MtrB/PioB family outer membrane beta-barrel protein [Vicinamibacterales bacterium]|nr:MtrB/PioB family outer membrane beta-barrel protein [Vicinamibacterales bacterium]